MFTDFNEDNIRTDFADFVPRDNIFLVRTDKTTETGGARDENGADKSGTFIEDKVTDTAQALAVAAVDNVFLT